MKTKITIERYRRTLITRRAALKAKCEFCESESWMISPNEAAVFQITARDIFRRVESGEIHFTETDAGGLLVCRRSLEKI